MEFFGYALGVVLVVSVIAINVGVRKKLARLGEKERKQVIEEAKSDGPVW